MKIYTKNGDNGKSALYGGERFSKSDLVFEVLGSLDELNANLGFLAHTKIICEVQNDLFLLGSHIANKKTPLKEFKAFSEKTNTLEKEIDSLEKKLDPLTNFILPGGSVDSSHAHLSRAVCRRLERLLVGYIGQKGVDIKKFKYILEYINRLSDLLFVLARYYNKKQSIPDQIWKMHK